MRICLIGLSLILSAPVLAQDAVPAPSLAGAPAIPAMTQVDIEILDALSSKTSKAGTMFRIRLAEPIKIGERTLVPAGIEGQGEVIHSAKARTMGKPGELILAARYLDFQGTRLPLRSFAYGTSAGKNRVDTAAAVAIAVGTPIALFVSGGQVEIPAGTRANAKLSADVALSATPALPYNSTEETKP